ncbi:MAG TPA: hypothetical protein VGM64_09450 [Lacunisphaera sp.]|jgi:hypothetical protein
MSPPSKLISRAWLIALLCASAFVIWSDCERGQRVAYVSNTDRDNAVADASSPTGYAGGGRWAIVPERNNRGYEWIAETQQMFARHEWRVRHIDYENAPFGRDVHAASPYRWWLGLLAWCDHQVSGRPIGISVERAALFADPLFHWLLLIATTVLVAHRFGSLPATIIAVGLATLYPFAGGFFPGIPDDHGLARACALWSILPLLAGSAGIEDAVKGSQKPRAFFLAGVIGGLGLWINAATETPVLAGIAVGGLLVGWLASDRGNAKHPAEREPPPWRWWALGGSLTCLAAYLIEYFPAHMDFHLQVNHSLYGLAWLGAGELIGRFATWRNGKNPLGQNRWFGVFTTVVAIAAIAALPVAMMREGNQLIVSGDLLSTRLTNLPGGAVAENILSLIGNNGLTGAVAGTLLPFLLIGPGLWLLIRRQAPERTRAALAIALGPLVVTVAFACFQLRWWNAADSMLLAFLVASVTIEFRRGWMWAGVATAALVPGIVQLVPSLKSGNGIEFTRVEVEALLERGAAHWIADRAGAGGAVVLLPPDRTTSWCFHGGFRGIGTANWENRDGLSATVRIVTATTAEQARELIRQHGITHIVLPSWDPDLDAFAHWTLRNPDDAFIMALHHWALPSWLRPIPYTLPSVSGFEDRSVVILAVTDESNRATALSHLAEYFIETKQPVLAATAGESLQRYPTDLGALVALASVEQATGNTEQFAKTFHAVLASLNSGFGRLLAWDRRVSLAVVLAQGERTDLSREQVRLCLQKVDEARLKSLTTMSLFRLLKLSAAFHIDFPEPKLRESALALLPAELRERL